VRFPVVVVVAVVVVAAVAPTPLLLELLPLPANDENETRGLPAKMASGSPENLGASPKELEVVVLPNNTPPPPKAEEEEEDDDENPNALKGVSAVDVPKDPALVVVVVVVVVQAEGKDFVILSVSGFKSLPRSLSLLFPSFIAEYIYELIYRYIENAKGFATCERNDE